MSNFCYVSVIVANFSIMVGDKHEHLPSNEATFPQFVAKAEGK